MQRFIPRVFPRTLLWIAGLVWIIAGGNILRIGVIDFIASWQQRPLYLLLSLGVFLVFMGLIFYPLVKKHNQRILQMSEEKVPFYLFFDGKSYLIMIFMMSSGILLRTFHLLPALVIGVLYCGIGSSLVGAGVLFLRKFFLAKKAHL